MLAAKSYPILCHSPSSFPSILKHQNPKPHSLPTSRIRLGRSQSRLLPQTHTPAVVLGVKAVTLPVPKRGLLQVCRDSVEGEDFEAGLQEKEKTLPERSGSGSNWATSVLLFGLWAGLMYYVFQLAPNQTPYRDTYFLQKLLNLRADDGFIMNEVLVALWYIMGLWPLVYSMLLIPTGRSSGSKVPVWPFLVVSFFGGAYALIPYFVLWRPPPPVVSEDEISSWPLKFLESKITAAITVAAGLGIIIYAGLADGEAWKEFYQYFRESKFIHITSIDFLLFTAFSPFWVYNDMTARRWLELFYQNASHLFQGDRVMERLVLLSIFFYMLQDQQRLLASASCTDSTRRSSIVSSFTPTSFSTAYVFSFNLSGERLGPVLHYILCSIKAKLLTCATWS